jgi:hypothetical protein
MMKDVAEVERIKGYLVLVRNELKTLMGYRYGNGFLFRRKKMGGPARL